MNLNEKEKKSETKPVFLQVQLLKPGETFVSLEFSKSEHIQLIYILLFFLLERQGLEFAGFEQ